MQKWLARLSFSFFILAALCAWELNKAVAAKSPQLNIWLLILGAAICTALGAIGVKARHRDE